VFVAVSAFVFVKRHDFFLWFLVYCDAR
jgi:hypothetical protein